MSYTLHQVKRLNRWVSCGTHAPLRDFNGKIYHYGTNRIYTVVIEWNRHNDDIPYNISIRNGRGYQELGNGIIDNEGTIIIYRINTLPKYKSHIDKICAEADLRCDIKDFIETVLL